MLAKTLILAMALSLLLMSTVVAFDYDKIYKRDDEPVGSKMRHFLFSRPRLRRNDDCEWNKNDQSDNLGPQNVEEQPHDDPLPETRLVRASRLQDLHLLDSSYHLQFKPRFGKRAFIYGKRFKPYAVDKNNYLNKWYITALR